MSRPLEKKLDEVFSLWVRVSNAKNGKCKCVTCGRIDNYKYMDAGHFVDRANMCTRFDELNVWPQCRTCNRLNGGEKKKFREFLEKKYGKTVVTELERAGRSVCKMYDPWFREAIKDYTARIKQCQK